MSQAQANARISAPIIAPAAENVRARSVLAEATRADHLALHRDPLLGKLSDPGLTAQDYRAALRVFAQFHEALEHMRARRDVWAAFGLQDECEDLRADLNAQAEHSAHALDLETPEEILGALYVAHGAAFGRGQFRRNVQAALPAASHRFVSRRPCSQRWKTLVIALDQTGANATGMARLIHGAQSGFAFVARASSRLRGERVVMMRR